MLLKIHFLLLIFTMATIVLVVETRAGRYRHSSIESSAYSRNQKKHGSPSSNSMRRKVVNGSTVHTNFIKSVTSGHKVDEKLAKFRLRHRSSHRSRSSHSSSRSSSHSSSSWPKSSNGHSIFSSSSRHHSYSHTDTPHTSYHSYGQSHTQPHRPNSQTHKNTWNLHGFSAAADHNTRGANSPISHTWGGHQLPPGHIYVAQPSGIPSSAVYYAQPPTYSSHTNDADDFINGYLIGHSLSQQNRHSHHHYYHHRSQSPQPAGSNDFTDAKSVSESNKNKTVSDASKINNTNQTHYWPTDVQVLLAPLNSSLLPENIHPMHQDAIFKSPPIHIAQTLTANNLTFELPAATTALPDASPANGIICMPWLFNETDPTHPERIVTIEKTVCFPAPSPPPPPTTTPPSSSSTTTTTTEVSVDECRDVVCPDILDFYSFTPNTYLCCFTDDKVLSNILDNTFRDRL
ncbi:filaggrin-2-like [Rhagoletis pomonella]|uniref:filaggrin-2-like n=1 Tax=Rhagoletis pomonella TaxID=28610 RepID=UPI00177EBF51|nr:filaggrin-2-like [Rhagoletis pomonella]